MSGDARENRESGRVSREFRYVNEDGQEGFVDVSFGPWGGLLGDDEAPIMVTFDDAPWMGVEQASEFQRWFRIALAEAKRKHVGRAPLPVCKPIPKTGKSKR